MKIDLTFVKVYVANTVMSQKKGKNIRFCYMMELLSMTMVNYMIELLLTLNALMKEVLNILLNGLRNFRKKIKIKSYLKNNRK